ncbi:uncharacterized protein LOC126993052 isoform X1 [Eriocheir sinensis]|uniref:uncharacterized protein LOC126993052 isoform X1 n=1 Tax=Eriocheir sinensis TaxID=95602 RepID=UPI0021CA2646|nr:uncharacterized protein LOC126993052 isoform X1 [Eriocheir sinensis]
MKARLPLLLVFIESSLLAAGNSFKPYWNPRCPAQITISGDEEWKNVTTEKYNWYDWSTVLYVHPDPGFKGIRLVAAGDGWLSDAWFTLDATCFPGDAQWWELWLCVWNYSSNNGHSLRFTVWAGDCALRCRRTGYFPDYRAVTVEAHGPSRWRSQYPNRPCTLKGYTRQSLSWINCTYIPITTTPTTTITIIVVSAMIGVGILVVLVAVMWRFRQRRISKEVPRVPPRRGLAVSWRVGGEAAIGDSRVEPPTGPTVHPRVAPRQQEPDYLYFGDDEEHIYDEFPDPLIHQEIPGPPIYEEIPGPPIYENISEHPRSHEAENLDSDDSAYLTPRRAPPGTPSGHPPSHEAEYLDYDDVAYLTPRRARLLPLPGQHATQG